MHTHASIVRPLLWDLLMNVVGNGAAQSLSAHLNGWRQRPRRHERKVVPELLLRPSLELPVMRQGQPPIRYCAEW
jgi:hypothetical protein